MSICCVYLCMFLLKQYWLQFVKKKSMRISTDIIVSYIIIIIYLFYFYIILLLYYFSLSKFVRFFFCSLLIIHPVKCSPNLSGVIDLTSHSTTFSLLSSLFGFVSWWIEFQFIHLLQNNLGVLYPLSSSMFEMLSYCLNSKMNT